jgi:hypothetical protein
MMLSCKATTETYFLFVTNVQPHIIYVLRNFTSVAYATDAPSLNELQLQFSYVMWTADKGTVSLCFVDILD